MNLFIKIFLWFLAAIALMVGVVIFLTYTTQTEPVVSRWQNSVKNQTNIYAETAAQIYSYEGEKGLTEFLNRIRNTDSSRNIDLIKLNSEGRFANFNESEILENLIAKTTASGEPELDFSSEEFG